MVHQAVDSDTYFFDRQTVSISDFASPGFILDIGGGGEGIIGLLKGSSVAAIDLRPDELEEAPEGPLKIVMDARELKFLDATFEAVTAFYSLMYLKSRPDHACVLAEVYRVMKPGGRFLIWDVSVGPAEGGEPIYVVPITVQVAGRVVKTGYGQRWPEEVRDLAYYVRLATETGFRTVVQQESGQAIHLVLEKPEAVL